MQIIQIHNKATDEKFLGIKITKDDELIFRDLGNNPTGRLKKDRIKGRKGQTINYVTLKTIKHD